MFSPRKMKLGRELSILRHLLLILGAISAAWTQEYDHTTFVSWSSPNSSDTPGCRDGGESRPCQTLNYALDGVLDSTRIVLAAEEHQLENSTVIRGIHQLAFVGDGELAEVNCEGDAGLTFIESSGIAVENVRFSGCGVLHNSTSRNFSDSRGFSFLEFKVGLYFIFCRDINFTHVTVTNSNGTGMVAYATAGENTFQSCLFSQNTANSTEYPGGGGLYVEFPFCTPGDLSCEHEKVSSVPIEYTSDSYYKFYNCRFEENVAEHKSVNNATFILPQRSNNLAMGRGGGLSFYFKGNASNNTVSIDACRFTSNKAIWGAGLFVEFQDNVTDNRVQVTDSLIDSNTCDIMFTSGGGGTRIAYLFYGTSRVMRNHVSFHSCNFSGNLAYWGGGLSLAAGRELNAIYATNTLEFTSCLWEGNMAFLGSAADLLAWHVGTNGTEIQPQFTNCSFRSNKMSYKIDRSGSNARSSIIGLGTVFADTIPIRFKGAVSFESNEGTALAAITTGIHIMEDTVVNFYNNSGRFGGAVALQGYAYLISYRNTTFNFTGNSAKFLGGAMFFYSVAQHDFRQSSGNCFIRYSEAGVPPTEWNTTFYFKDNKAAQSRNSIYATSVLNCEWWYDGQSDVNYTYAKQVFCWDNSWIYEDSDCGTEILTDPAMLDGSEVMNVIPGQQTPLPISATDDLGKNASDRTVLIAEAVSTFGSLEIDRSSIYISDNHIEFHGEAPSNGTLILETPGPRVLRIWISVDLRPCPPGFVQVGPSNSTECQCGGDFGGLGYIKCYGEEFRSEIHRGAWIGYYNYSGKWQLVASDCPYCSTYEKEYLNLPSDPRDIDAHICGRINRTGVLCAKCKDGYGPALNSKFLVKECVPCSEEDAKYHWFLYLLNEFLPTTIFFFIVALFNISVTTGPANGFVFFAQVVTTVFGTDSDGTIPLTNVTSAAPTLQNLYLIPYGIWNLDFFRPVLPKFCLSPNISTVQLMMLAYVTALYPLLLVIFFALMLWLYDHNCKPIVSLCRPVHKCFYHLRRRWNLQRSLLHVFGTFLLLSYTKFTLVSVVVITQSPLYTDTGEAVGPGVMYFNGEITIFSDEYTPYLVAAAMVLAIFVVLPPIILVLPSLFKALEKVGVKCFTKWQPGPKLRYLFNIFHGCYKDGTEPGTHDFRWFAGLYFFLRLVLYILYPSTQTWLKQYIGQQIFCTFGILVFTLLRPYRIDWYNKLDAIIFGLLAAINTFTIYNYFLLTNGQRLSTASFVIQYILIFIPLIYMIIYTSYHVWVTYSVYIQSLKMKLKKCFGRADEELLENQVSNRDREDTFMTFSEAIEASGRDREPNTYRPPSLTQETSEATLLLSDRYTDSNPAAEGKESYDVIGEETMGPDCPQTEAYSTFATID